MSILAISLVGKNNEPLFFHSNSETSENIHLQMLTYYALDVMEERKKLITPGNSSGSHEMFLGLLFPSEDYKVYGQFMNSQYKIIVIVEAYSFSLGSNDFNPLTYNTITTTSSLNANQSNSSPNIISSISTDYLHNLMKEFFNNLLIYFISALNNPFQSIISSSSISTNSNFLLSSNSFALIPSQKLDNNINSLCQQFSISHKALLDKNSSNKKR